MPLLEFSSPKKHIFLQTPKVTLKSFCFLGVCTFTTSMLHTLWPAEILDSLQVERLDVCRSVSWFVENVFHEDKLTV